MNKEEILKKVKELQNSYNMTFFTDEYLNRLSNENIQEVLYEIGGMFIQLGDEISEENKK